MEVTDNLLKGCLDIINLQQHIEKNINDFLNKNPENDQEAKIIDILNVYKDKSTSGNPYARDIMKNHIKTKLLYGFHIYQTNDDNSLDDMFLIDSFSISENDNYINYIMPFNNYSLLTPVEKFEIILQKFYGKNPNNLNIGFEIIISKYDDMFSKIRSTDFYKSTRYEISEEDINFIFDKEINEISFADKIEVVTQIIYENLYGLKSIDILAYSNINEVGTANDGKYVYCWCNKKYWLSFITFNEEETRIIQERSISFDKNVPQLDESNPEVLCHRYDNARITATQKPYFSARNVCIRIFNQSNAEFKDIISSNKLRTLITAIVKNGDPTILQGGLGVGKTTTMQLLFELLDDYLHIGTVEDYFEQHNMSKYPYKRVVEGQALKNKSLQDVVKTLLRMSVDVADLGEGRDGEAIFSFIQLVQSVSLAAWLTAHIISPDNTVPRLKNMLMGTGRYFSEQSAVMDIIHSIRIILQHEFIDGQRCITKGVEIVPLVSTSCEFTYDPDMDKDTLEKLYYIQQIQSNTSNMYRLNTIFEYVDGDIKFLNYPSKFMIDKAKKNKDSWMYMKQLLKLIELDVGIPYDTLGGDN